MIISVYLLFDVKQGSFDPSGLQGPADVLWCQGPDFEPLEFPAAVGFEHVKHLVVSGQLREGGLQQVQEVRLLNPSRTLQVLDWGFHQHWNREKHVRETKHVFTGGVRLFFSFAFTTFWEHARGGILHQADPEGVVIGRFTEPRSTTPPLLRLISGRRRAERQSTEIFIFYIFITGLY